MLSLTRNQLKTKTMLTKTLFAKLQILTTVIVAMLFGALIAHTLFEADSRLFFVGCMCLMFFLILQKKTYYIVSMSK